MYVMKVFIYMSNYPVFSKELTRERKCNFLQFYTNIEIAGKKKRLLLIAYCRYQQHSNTTNNNS